MSTVKIQPAQSRLTGQLARSEVHRATNVARLEQIVAAADAKHKALNAQIPDLARLADSAVGEERDTAHRDYLVAIQDRHNCARVHGAAMRQLIIAKNL